MTNKEYLKRLYKNHELQVAIDQNNGKLDLNTLDETLAQEYKKIIATHPHQFDYNKELDIVSIKQLWIDCVFR